MLWIIFLIIFSQFRQVYLYYSCLIVKAYCQYFVLKSFLRMFLLPKRKFSLRQLFLIPSKIILIMQQLQKLFFDLWSPFSSSQKLAWCISQQRSLTMRHLRKYPLIRESIEKFVQLDSMIIFYHLIYILLHPQPLVELIYVT